MNLFHKPLTAAEALEALRNPGAVLKMIRGFRSTTHTRWSVEYPTPEWDSEGVRAPLTWFRVDGRAARALRKKLTLVKEEAWGHVYRLEE